MTASAASAASGEDSARAARGSAGEGDFRFSHRLRVRWAEVDAQRVVFNAHYLTYFDVAFFGYWHALALPYAETLAQLGGDVYVRHAALDFRAPARFDDSLSIALRCERIGGSSLVFEGMIFRAGAPLVGVELVYVFSDPAGTRAQAVPEVLRRVIGRFEAGGAATALRVGPWSELQGDATAVRTAVFIGEQHIAPADELDAHDATSLHAVIRNGLDAPVATARLLPSEAGAARIGRMAVLRELRGRGLGRDLIDALEQAARARGDHEVRLSAQLAAEGFYRRRGYQRCSEPYDEVGIAHVAMARALA